MVIIVAGFICGALLTASLDHLVAGDFSPLISPIGIVSLASQYFLLYFVAIYFNVALIGCSMIRFEGGDPTVRDSFRTSDQKLDSILKWTLITATVGVILRIVQEKFEGMGRILTGIAGVAWSLATFFVVPVLVYEKKSPLDCCEEERWLVQANLG